MSWQDLNQIISNIKKRGSLERRFKKAVLQDFLEKKYGINNFSWRGNKVEITTENTILAQELFLKKEEIKKELNRILAKNLNSKDNEKSFYIQEIIIKRER